MITYLGPLSKTGVIQPVKDIKIGSVFTGKVGLVGKPSLTPNSHTFLAKMYDSPGNESVIDLLNPENTWTCSTGTYAIHDYCPMNLTIIGSSE